MYYVIAISAAESLTGPCYDATVHWENIQENTLYYFVQILDVRLFL